MTLRTILPKLYSDTLFGDREKWGRTPDVTDPAWIEWTARVPEIYQANQKSGVGNRVNNAGYRILRTIDFSAKTVLEIGPGHITHLDQWVGLPNRYILVDQSEEFLASAEATLRPMNMVLESHLVGRHGPALEAIPDQSVDVVLSFANLEHLHPLDDYLQEMQRVLKPMGILAGAIPAEGGLAWGLGRYFTSRRWFEKHTNIDLYKLICWEHPNFADEILESISNNFRFERRVFWPTRLPSIDTNLMVSFVAIVK